MFLKGHIHIILYFMMFLVPKLLIMIYKWTNAESDTHTKMSGRKLKQLNKLIILISVCKSKIEIFCNVEVKIWHFFQQNCD